MRRQPRGDKRRLQGIDTIAACSRGCRSAFIRAMPELAEKCRIVPNFHQYEKIRALAAQAPYCYADGQLHVLMVARLAHEKGVDRSHPRPWLCACAGYFGGFTSGRKRPKGAGTAYLVARSGT